MALRLPHVLALMALVLAAGVLSIGHLEADTGAGTVPGLIVVEVPDLDTRAAAELSGSLPGARIQWVAAGEGPLQPFATDFAARRAAEGAATLLVDAAPVAEEAALRRGWRVIIAAPEEPPAPDAASRAVQVVADYVRRQTGVRAFLIALDPGLPEGIEPEARLPELVGPLLAAANALPRTRRTCVVLLGAREPESRRRIALRFDFGAWTHHVRPGLADLLEEDW